MLSYFQNLIFFLCVPASAADAAAVNPKVIYTLLANGLITFDIKGNGPNDLPRNPPDCIIFDNWVFDNLISIDELFAKALRILQLVGYLIIIYEEDQFHYRQSH